MLLLVSLAALDLGAWQISRGWGLLANYVLLGVFVVWLVGPRRFSSLEPSVATERKLELVGKRADSE